MRQATRFWPMLGLLLLCGCTTGENPSKVFPVSGKISLTDGQPLRGAQVRLVAKIGGPHPGGADAFGPVESDGSFKLMTMDNKEGAMPGLYKVVITPNDKDPKTSSADKAFAKQNIPKKYT